jgi:hypothetical protein
MRDIETAYLHGRSTCGFEGLAGGEELNLDKSPVVPGTIPMPLDNAGEYSIDSFDHEPNPIRTAKVVGVGRIVIEPPLGNNQLGRGTSRFYCGVAELNIALAVKSICLAKEHMETPNRDPNNVLIIRYKRKPPVPFICRPSFDLGECLTDLGLKVLTRASK